jgi:hypothetical protein
VKLDGVGLVVTNGAAIGDEGSGTLNHQPSPLLGSFDAGAAEQARMMMAQPAAGEEDSLAPLMRFLSCKGEGRRWARSWRPSDRGSGSRRPPWSC